jgi:hypothetical protein
VTDDTLIYGGGECKALGSGKVGGYLVRFGGPESADVQGDYFTAGTDFGLGEGDRLLVYYHHGLDRDFGRRHYGHGHFKADPVGLAIEAQLDLNTDRGRRIYGDAEAGKLGWSSGSAERFVERGPAVKGARAITYWPLNDATLSPKPVDPRNKVIALKALVAMKGEHLGGDVGASLASSALDRLHYHTAERINGHMRDPKKSRDEKLAACKGCLDEHRATARKVVGALLDDDEDVVKALIGDAAAALPLSDRAEALVADAEAMRDLFAKLHDQRQADGRSLSPAKRESIKAIADALEALHAETAPRPDPAELERLRRRLLAARI